MKKIYLLVLFVICGFLNTTNAQNFQWAKSFDGPGGYDYGTSVAVDASGNVYTTGGFNDSVDFDPGAATLYIHSKGASDIFVSKLDASGNLVWIKTIGGSEDEWGNSIAVDASGNVFITGIFRDNVDFDPGAATYNLIAQSGDVFVCKLNASGNFVWARSMGGFVDDLGSSIALDASGNVYTTGYFGSTADFDPGAGTYNLTTSGGQNMFVSKLDASGNFVWAKAMSDGTHSYGNSICLDAAGNVYTTGYFLGTADFDPGAGTYNLTTLGGDEVFISKLDALGNFVWAKAMGGTGASDYAIGYSIAVDPSGNVYSTGRFIDTADFDPDSTSTYNLTTGGNVAAFISKLDASGNFVWAKTMGGTTSGNPAIGYSIAVDPLGNVYTTGNFSLTVDFDPGVGTFNLTGNNYISKLDASGNFIWAVTMGPSGVSVPNSIALDGSGNLYTTGHFLGTVDFDPGAGTYNLTSTGFSSTSDDVFVLKLSSVTGIAENGNMLSNMDIIPNPFSTTTIISFSLPQSDKITVKVFDIAGRLVATLANAEMQKGNHQLEWNATDKTGNAVAPGVYICEVSNKNGVIKTEKVVKE